MLELNEDEVRTDCSLDKNNIEEEIKNISGIRAKYRSKFRKVKTDLVNAEVELQDKYAERFRFYNERYDIKLKPTEIPPYINNDEEYKPLYKNCQILRKELENLKDILDDLTSKSYNIKNLIEYRRQIYNLGGNPNYE